MNLSRRLLLCALGASGMQFGARKSLSEVARGSSRVISVAEFGVTPSVYDAGPGVQAAILELSKAPGSTLFFPMGIYRFAQTSGVAMLFDGLNGVVLDGGGATLLFRGTTQPIIFRQCAKPMVRRLCLDWVRPPFSQGEVIHSEPGVGSIDFRVDPEFPVDGSESIEALATYDRASQLISPVGIDLYKGVTGVELVRAQVLRVSFDRATAFKPGDTLVVRHQVYGGAAINLQQCSAVTIEDVKIYASPGMGIVGSHCADVTVRNVGVLRAPGTNRLLSTCADAIHFAEATGWVSIENCVLSGMGDDCINIHDRYLKVVRQIDSRTLLVALRGDQVFKPVELAYKGEEFALLKGQTLASSGSDTVESAEGQSQETLHFNRDLPSNIQSGDFLSDITSRPSVTVSDCRFPGNRARGILAHSDVTVENCEFANQSAEAILLAADLYWLEGPAAIRIKISDNYIDGSLRRSAASAAVKIGINIGDSMRSNAELAIVHHDIDVTRNTIRNSGGAAILAFAAENLRIQDNRIERPATSAITLSNVRNVSVVGNKCVPNSPLLIDKQSLPQVSLKENTGMFIDSSALRTPNGR